MFAFQALADFACVGAASFEDLGLAAVGLGGGCITRKLAVRRACSDGDANENDDTKTVTSTQTERKEVK